MKVNEDIRAMVAAYCRTVMNIKEIFDFYKPVTKESSIYEQADASAKKSSVYHYEGYLNGLALGTQIVSGVYFSAPSFYLSKETKLDEMKIVVSWTDEKFVFHAGDYPISNIIKHGYEGAYEAADELIAFVNEAS
jgi:hypothetical protein